MEVVSGLEAALEAAVQAGQLQMEAMVAQAPFGAEERPEQDIS